MRVLLALMLALPLAACGSGGVNPIVKRALADINPLERLGGRDEPAEGSGKPAPRLTRAAVNKSGAAMIRARLIAEDNRSVLLGATQNGGYVTYISQLGQSITLRGSQVTATRGLGFDLLSATSTGRDPVAYPTPPAAWPAGLTRQFELPGEGPRGRLLTFECRFERGEARAIEIVEVTHQGIEFSEYCSDGEIEFENLHLADARTGFVWRSIQWTGPDLGSIDIEVIEPLD
jgi:hypothetical protein